MTQYLVLCSGNLQAGPSAVPVLARARNAQHGAFTGWGGIIFHRQRRIDVGAASRSTGATWPMCSNASWSFKPRRVLRSRARGVIPPSVGQACFCGCHLKPPCRWGTTPPGTKKLPAQTALPDPGHGWAACCRASTNRPVPQPATTPGANARCGVGSSCVRAARPLSDIGEEEKRCAWLQGAVEVQVSPRRNRDGSSSCHINEVRSGIWCRATRCRAALPCSARSASWT